MRYFDVDAAQRLLPLLTSSFAQIRSRVERIEQLTRELRPASPAGEQSSPSGTLEAEGQRLAGEVQEEIAKLEVIGVEVKSLEGLVDFRALRSGRTVYLCWRLGEPTVGYWHEVDAGFAGRKPIDSRSAFEPSYLS